MKIDMESSIIIKKKAHDMESSIIIDKKKAQNDWVSKWFSRGFEYVVID